MKRWTPKKDQWVCIRDEYAYVYSGHPFGQIVNVIDKNYGIIVRWYPKHPPTSIGKSFIRPMTSDEVTLKLLSV